MHQSEKLVKQELIKKGFKVWRRGVGGMPDFECVGNLNQKHIYVEVKSGSDGLNINQLKKITELLQNGFQVYLYHINKEKKLDSYEITTILKISEPQIQINNIKSKSCKLKCECGQILEGLTRGQVEHLIKQHKLGRIHKRAIEKQQNAKR